MKMSLTGREIKKYNVGDMFSLAAINEIDFNEVKKELQLHHLSTSSVEKHIKGYIGGYITIFEHAKMLIPDDAVIECKVDFIYPRTTEVDVTLSIGEMRIHYCFTFLVTDTGVRGSFEVSGMKNQFKSMNPFDPFGLN